MKVTVLASGSKGNVTIVETEKHKLLIDLGTNVKYIKESLEQINVVPEEIDYVIFTHTHKDHVSALDSFIRKYKPAICISQKMFYDLPCLNDYERIIIYDDELILEDLNIEIFRTSHDTSDSRGFIFTNNDSSFVYVTDTGYLNLKNFAKMKNKDLYIIESNHDPEMLRNGKYPLWLQNRVLSDYGHLSNEMAASYLTKLIGPKTKKIILAHLSEENNREEVALETIYNKFHEENIEFNNIVCARQHEILESVLL